MPATENMTRPQQRILNSLIDPVATNFWLQKINPIWSYNQALGKIVAKKNTAADMVSLTIRTNRLFSVGSAGQHHPVIVEIKGRRYERTYSLTQISPKEVMLTVKKVQQGVVSTWLVDQAKVGDVIEFAQPYGDMCLSETPQNLVLLAAGSGITPMYSLIEAWAQKNSFALQDQQQNQQQVQQQDHQQNQQQDHQQQNQQQAQQQEQQRQQQRKPSLEQTQATPPQTVASQLQLLYWVKRPEDSAFVQRFEQLSKTYNNFKFKVFYTQADQADERLNSSHLELIEQPLSSHVYVCGPSGFVAAAQLLFVANPDLKTEAFSLSPMSNLATGFVNVTLTKSNKTVTIPRGQSILVGLEQQNIRPTHGCRMGICNKCACEKAQGASKNLVNGSENTEPGHLLKLCVNSAQSDLVIDL
ncbi:2Fe-2S iron-sulfur cluster protein [Acinetobacter calcoaceticus]|uniref:2Fe-2S iron-sulfur cluster protein n=1 Tax=Acinetobacter calcoaceticus TaxID=471 RepID=A0A4R1XYZ1_ACICA|nr:2Fe-2S iron-sulfur cluster protein [Acinetobacter calcoaceticus]